MIQGGILCGKSIQLLFIFYAFLLVWYYYIYQRCFIIKRVCLV